MVRWAVLDGHELLITSDGSLASSRASRLSTQSCQRWIRGGGGTKEMLARAMEALPAGADQLPHIQRVFETIGFAKVSTSGPDARRIGYLREGDEITMNRDRLLGDQRGKRPSLSPQIV